MSNRNDVAEPDAKVDEIDAKAQTVAGGRQMLSYSLKLVKQGFWVVLMISMIGLLLSEKTLEEQADDLNEMLFKTRQYEATRKVVEAFPYIEVDPPLDGMTYDKITHYTETQLRPWAKSIADYEDSFLEVGKRIIQTPHGEWREFTGKIFDGKLVGRIIATDDSSPGYRAFVYKDKWYGNCKYLACSDYFALGSDVFKFHS